MNPITIDDRLPRIICDKCMVDAEAAIYTIGPHNELVLIRCHETEELMRLYALTQGTFSGNRVVVWANIQSHFLTPADLAAFEKSAVEGVVTQIGAVQLYHRVRRAQGAPATFFSVDEAIDTLFLFRRDPSLPAPPALVEEPRPVSEPLVLGAGEVVGDPRWVRHKERQAALAAKRAADAARKTGEKGPF